MSTATIRARVPFGTDDRFALELVETRFGSLCWFVTEDDGENVVRQTYSFHEALDGLVDDDAERSRLAIATTIDHCCDRHADGGVGDACGPRSEAV